MADTRASNSRIAADRQERSTQDRKKVWAPPEVLDVPPPIPGFKFRYVRKDIRGEDDTKNVLRRVKQHYEPVKASELPGFETQLVEDGKHEGVCMSGDLILMKVPDEIVEQREAYYQRETDRQQNDIDQQLEKEDNALMPIRRSRKSEKSFGNPGKEVTFKQD